MTFPGLTLPIDFAGVRSRIRAVGVIGKIGVFAFMRGQVAFVVRAFFLVVALGVLLTLAFPDRHTFLLGLAPFLGVLALTDAVFTELII